jgi:hypothetical protein
MLSSLPWDHGWLAAASSSFLFSVFVSGKKSDGYKFRATKWAPTTWLLGRECSPPVSTRGMGLDLAQCFPGQGRCIWAKTHRGHDRPFKKKRKKKNQGHDRIRILLPKIVVD